MLVKVSPQHRVRFATEAETQVAGYRLARNGPEVFFAADQPDTRKHSLHFLHVRNQFRIRIGRNETSTLT